jgi:putative aldouronate transport system substrate-binding protein
MILSIASCGTATPAATAATAAAATTAAATTKEAAIDPLAPYSETVTVTWAFQTAAAVKLLDGDTNENNRWSRLLKEKLNIDLKLAFVADSSTDAYKTKLNAVIASGDLPDIF